VPASFDGHRAKSSFAVGTIGVVYAADEHHVIKVPTSGDFERLAYDIEIRVYAQLGHHERIAHCESQEESLRLDRRMCLRCILHSDS
jgi:hypothetical protein